MFKFYRYVLLGLIWIINLPATANPYQWAESLNLTHQRVLAPVFNSEIQLYFANQDKTDLPSLTLIHGVGGSAQDFTEIIPRLAKKYKLVIVDLPGYGLSERTDSLYSAANYAASLAALLPDYINRHNIVIGHSMGGNISLQLVNIAPALADKLILIDAAGLLHKYSYSKYAALHQTNKIPYIGEKLQKKLSNTIDKINSWLPNNIVDLVLSQPSRELILQQNTSYISALSVMNEDLTGIFDNITTPTLIIWGIDDPVMPYQVGFMLNSLLPQSQLEFIDKAGHSPQKTRTAKVNELVEKFIKKSKQKDQPEQLSLKNEDYLLDCKKNNKTKLEQLAYRTIRIENCSELTLHHVFAEKLQLLNSSVSVQYLTLQNHQDYALEAKRSQLMVWGGKISSDKGMLLTRSQADFNGVIITTGSSLIKSDQFSHILASVSQAQEADKQHLWHGFVLRSGRLVD
ncbi:alpha/beta hydrolase [Catenovulum sp. 2E275]|uniref:alpha/beta fold hydrolase n=1 Tax=Catenovulum sp. 2E275 TaxID=2980497 RepID=UPI0021D2A706|nr:alpha/beta hydrolase [Catenovulum sp. 2E275]MCU4676644.1 alpha/beta hydrolase [Catenovulum sp. 2E275]